MLDSEASHLKRKALALLQTLWQVVYLGNSTTACSETSDSHQLLHVVHQEHNVFLTPSELPCPVAWNSGYSLISLLPTAALAHHVVIAEHDGCVAAASHRGDRFLLWVHKIPAPVKKAPGETSRSLVPQLPNPHPQWDLTQIPAQCTEDSQTQEVYKRQRGGGRIRG